MPSLISSSQHLQGCFTVQPGSYSDPRQLICDADTIRNPPYSKVETMMGRVSSTGSIDTFGKCGYIGLAGTPSWISTELREEAVARGNVAALTMAYRKYGRDFLDYVTGPFSFVIGDSDADKFLAGIDRLGLHTLYYAREDQTLRFGTTATAILEQSASPPELNEQGIYDYFYFHMVPSPQSVYQGLRKLPAGHCLELSGGKLSVFRYWTPKFSRKSAHSFSDLSLELKQLLSKSVERSLEGAGKVGTFLSGGLDSSTVTGMLSELTETKRPAYAIGFDQEGYDEMEFARNTAKHFGVPLREYYVTPQDVLDALPAIATSYDEPFGNSSALPAYFCGKRAKEDGLDCLLAGDGGDEIFAGNGRYAKQQVFSMYSKIPPILRSAIVEPLLNALPQSSTLGNKAKSYVNQARIPLPDRLQSYNYLNRMLTNEIFTEDFLAAVNTDAPLDLQRHTYHSLDQVSDLSRMLYLDWQYTLADNDLKKVNRMCDMAGIGVRYPMLDEELVAFSCQVPDHWKLRRGQLRYFFKQSLADWLPAATINKKKQGFGLPFGLWMQSYRPLNEMANDSILRLKGRGYFKDKFLDRLVRLHKEEHAAYYGELIWVLTIFDLWLEGHEKRPKS